MRIDRRQKADPESRALHPPVPDEIPDLRGLFSALRPLGDSTPIIQRAISDPIAFSRVCDLFLATAPDEYDPVVRLVDGVNHSLYRLAKAILTSLPETGHDGFTYDSNPDEIETVAKEALDRLEAVTEYSDGHNAGSADARMIRGIIEDSCDQGKLGYDMVETLLKRIISIGGRYGLDAANLLGFIYYRSGDLDAAEILFRTVIERRPADVYERETQAHAMNNLTGVHIGRHNLKQAILWGERSLMLKEGLGLDASTNYLNLLFFWLESATPYALDRARHYLRMLATLDGGRELLERTLLSEGYRNVVEQYTRAGLDKEFPEIRIPELVGTRAVQQTFGDDDGKEQSAG